MRPHRRQPTRLPHPWDFPGKSTGVGCHCLLRSSAQFSSITQSCPTLCDPVNRSTPGVPVHHQLPESTQTHVRRVSDAIQASHPLSSLSLFFSHSSKLCPLLVFSGNTLQYSCLENPVDGGAWWAAVHRVTQSRTRLKRLSSSSSTYAYVYH